jgi:DNA-binding FadR family transcriptional regulator
MSIEQERQSLFQAATGEDMSAMKQAVRLAYSFEHELLSADHAPGAIAPRDLMRGSRLSRSLANEVIRILQAREVIRAKPGPHGGLVAVAPSSSYLREVVTQYIVHTRMSVAATDQAREGVAFLQAALSADHPGMAVVHLMADVLDQFSGWPAAGAEQGRQRASRIARQLAIRMLQSCQVENVFKGQRLGHEMQLCEQFATSRPVVRQAIRILQAQSLVETRRGRGCGLFLAPAQAGPVARLIAMWLLDRGLYLHDILDVERPLRSAVALLAVRNARCVAGHPILELQRQSEVGGGIRLSALIEMEKNISWLSGNALLDLFLRTITVYKICRGHYREADNGGLDPYLDINRGLLQSLIRRSESGVLRACEAKNACLGEYDLRLGSAPAGCSN